ncbi:MAG: Ig-like domain-containing protein, partial [Elusimicrobiales bacterium]
GAKTLYAWAKDAAGNVSASLNDSITITLPDVSSPTVTAFTIPAVASTLKVSIAVLTATDNIGVTGYLVNESSVRPLPGAVGWTAGAPSAYTFVSAGAKTLYAWAKDAAGNVSAGLSGTVTVDISSPAVSIIAPADGSTVAGTVIVSGLSSDNIAVSSVAVSVDGVAYSQAVGLASWTFSLNTTLLSNGLHTLTARATDSSGNAKTAVISVTVDNLAPVISVVRSAGITASSATITWTTNEAADSQVEYGLSPAYGSSNALDTAKVTAHSQALTGLQPQTVYHYHARSMDAAGNTAYSADYILNTISLTVPNVSILSPVDGQKVEKTVQVTLSGSASAALIAVAELWVDGVRSAVHNFAPAVASFNIVLSWKTTSGGNHRLQARCCDTLGVCGTSGTINVSVAGKPKVVLVGNSNTLQEEVTGGSGDAQPRALLLSQKAGRQQTLMFDEDIREAALVDLKGRVIKKASRQGGSLVLSLQNAQDTGIGMTSGLLLIQMKDSSGKSSVKPLMVVK